VADRTVQTLTGRVVLGCDGATSSIRELAGIAMEDLGFTERWLVVDIRAEAGLDTWDDVEQVCDPARAATFMRVTGDRYRWEFQMRDGEDEADLINPQALGRPLRPWTGRADLGGLELTRSATYTFRAGLASRFQAGRAGEDLLATYDTERRPHAKAMVKKAVMAGWAMTGGQDRAAAIRRIALAAAVRSTLVCEAMGSTATPRLKTGALQRVPRRLFRARTPAVVRIGGLIPNPLVCIGAGAPVRLDAVL